MTVAGPSIWILFLRLFLMPVYACMCTTVTAGPITKLCAGRRRRAQIRIHTVVLREIETVCTDVVSALYMQIGLFCRSHFSAVDKRDLSAAQI